MSDNVQKKKLKKSKKRSSEESTSIPINDNKKHKGSDSSKRIKNEDVKKEPSIEKAPHSALKQLSIKSDPIGSNSTQLRVQVSDSSPTSDPIVVSFPAGLPSSLASVSTSRPRSVHFNDEEQNNNNHDNSQPPVFTWTKVRKSSTKGRIIHGSDDTCTYIASNEGKGYDGRLTKFYVGLYHKPTSTLKLIPSSERGTVFAMSQSVTSYHDSRSLDVRNLSIADRRRMAFESFGSQKKKKVLRSQQANVVEMRSVVGAGEGMMKALGKQMDDNKMSESNLKVMEDFKNQKDGKDGGKIMSAIERAYAEARRSFLPPFDETASKPFKVYDSQEVAGEEAWAQISRTVDACLHKGDGWKEAIQGRRPWPDSMKAMLNSIGDPATKKGVKYQIKTALLVNYLVKFHNRATKKFMDGSQEEMAKYLGLPKEVSDRFLALFCAPSHDRGRAGFATSKQLKDRRVIYTLVMYLLAHGKDMKVGSIEKICEDMRLETKDAINLYREAGCKCIRNKAGMVSVSLTVPLEFPPPKRGKKT